MKTSTIIIATLLLAATVPLAKAESLGDGWPRQNTGVTAPTDRATEAQRAVNQRWQAEAFDHQGERGGCNADFVPTWAMGPRSFGGCYADSFGKATEGGSN